MSADQCSIASEHFSEFASQWVVASEGFACFAASGVVDSDHQLCVASECFASSLPDCSLQLVSHPALDSDGQLCVAKQKHKRQRAELRTLQQKVRRKDNVVAGLKKELALAAASISQSPCNHTIGKHHLPHAGLMVALRRNMGHMSNKAAGLMSDTSRQTVGRWEIRLGTCVIASMINFHRDGEHMMVDGAGGGGMRLAVHMFIGDATKSSAWKSHKVQSLHITSAYFFGLAERDSLPVVYDKSCWSDCQIADDCSGTGMMQLIHKQLRSAGCPALDLVDAGCRDSFRLVISCGDDGPDQKLFRRLMLEKYRCSPYMLCSVFSCILHHQCLGVKRVLVLTDLLCTRYAAGNILYYSGCVKIANLLRSKPIAVQRAAEQLLHPDSFAYTFLTSRKIQRMDAGRWGYCHDCEDSLRKIGRQHLCTVVRHVFSTASKNKTVNAHGAAHEPRDDEHIDEYIAHNAKMGRWAREATCCINSVWYWVMLELSFVVKAPWQELLSFVQLRQTSEKWLERYGAGNTHTSVLVCGKAAELESKFHDMLDMSSWQPLVTQWALEMDSDCTCEVYCCIVSIILTSYVEWHYRVTLRYEAWPYPLMLLTHKHFAESCPLRLKCARLLLSSPVESLDGMSAKIRFHFRRDLEMCILSGGRLHVALWRLIWHWQQAVPSDMQQNEGMNSVITYMTKLSVNLDLPLLGSRLTIKTENSLRRVVCLV